MGSAMQPIKPSTNIAIFEIACVLFGNVFTMVVGILSLVFYNDAVVKDYFAHMNGGFGKVKSVETSASLPDSGQASAEKPDSES